MGYQTGSQGAETNCAAVFMGTLDTFMLANGYSDVETWTSSTKTANVYKSASADNGVANFYITVYRTADTAASIYFELSEDYDAVNHKLMKYVPYTGVGKTVNSADNTVTDATGLLPDATGTPNLFTVSLTIQAASFSYWMSVNHHRIVIATRCSTSDDVAYVGQVVNMLSTTDFPYSGVCNWAGYGQSGAKAFTDTPSAAYGGFTREPGAPAAAAANFSGAVCNSTIWPQGMATSVDWVYKTGNVAGRIPLYSCRDASALFIPRALLPVDCIGVPRLTTAVNGDTVTLNSKTYVRMGYSTSWQLFVDNSV